MNCHHHPNREATAQCSQCGKLLCQKCASLYSPPFCAECANKGAGEIKSELFTLGGLGALMAIFYIFSVFSSGASQNPLYIIICGVVFGFVPFGWRTLTSITPRIFLVLPVVGWAIYFVLKLFLSVLICWFVGPYKIYKDISILKSIEKKEAIRMQE